jgi:hypothetical protein
MLRTLKKMFVCFTLAAMTFVGFTQSVQAAMVGTGEAVAAAQAQGNRERVTAALARPDIQAQLETMGVDPADASARVAALSDSDVSMLAQRLDSLPAGGDSILGVILFVFILLLVTDLLGLTKVFPFTRSQR